MKEPARRTAQAEKQAALGILGGGLAHEIGNPNQVIRLGADFFARAWGAAESALDRSAREDADLRVGGIPWQQARAEVPAAIENIRAACVRIDAVVRGLVRFARPDSDAPPTLLDLNLVVTAALTRTTALVRPCPRHIAVDLAPTLPPVRGCLAKMQEAIVNVVTNACQSLRSPQDALGVSTAFDDGTKEVVLLVVDGGRGMSPAQLQQIKDPFFTTRRESGGLGLGVPIADAIITAHGGSLAYESTEGRGTTAIVRLPADPGPAADA